MQLSKIADGCRMKREMASKSSTNIRAVTALDVGRVENSMSLVMMSSQTHRIGLRVKKKANKFGKAAIFDVEQNVKQNVFSAQRFCRKA